MVVEIMVLGVGATLSMDLWALLRRRWFGVASLDYGWVGRWLGHMRHGQFRHTAIAKAAPLRGERLLGWGFHYLTGLLFAAAFLAWGGQAWLQRPALLPALLPDGAAAGKRSNRPRRLAPLDHIKVLYEGVNKSSSAKGGRKQRIMHKKDLLDAVRSMQGPSKGARRHRIQRRNYFYRA